MPRLRLVIALLCAFWLAWPARAQEASRRLTFERLSVEEGLPQVTVEDVIQDRQGFMWFATHNGLGRYDGYDFKVYRPEPGNPRSISSNIVTALYEDAGGTLWVGTNRGLNRLDRGDDTFTRYRHDPDDSTSLGGGCACSIRRRGRSNVASAMTRTTRRA